MWHWLRPASPPVHQELSVQSEPGQVVLVGEFQGYGLGDTKIGRFLVQFTIL